MSQSQAKTSGKTLLLIVLASAVAAFVTAFTQRLIFGDSKVWITVPIVLVVVFLILQLSRRSQS